MSVNLDDIHSNLKMICARCGDPITWQNYSGWEVFVTGDTTQPICTFCNMVSEAPGEKCQEGDADD